MNNITVAVELITPNSAKEYLKSNTHNRIVHKETVSFYSKQMIEGNWQLSPEGISFDKYGNLIDGQHRLMSVIESNMNIQFLVSRGFNRDVFSVINTGKNRSAKDVLSISNIKNASRVAAMIKKVSAIKKKWIANKSSFKNLRLSNTDVLNFYE